MKTVVALLCLMPLHLLGQAKDGPTLAAEGLRKYAAESGKITYTITGDAQGDEIMIFDLYGWRSMRKQTMLFELYGIKTVQTLHEIVDGDYSFRLNEGDSTYISRKDFKWSQQAAYKEPNQVSEAILFSMGGTQVADSTMLDRTCQVWTFNGKALQELWIWNGLPLKRKRKLGDRIIFSTATRIEMSIQAEESLFTIPAHLKEKK